MKYKDPAAFGRLCVETIKTADIVAVLRNQPPSGGCVLKRQFDVLRFACNAQPPSGGCVLKRQPRVHTGESVGASRLRAAVC